VRRVRNTRGSELVSDPGGAADANVRGVLADLLFATYTLRTGMEATMRILATIGALAIILGMARPYSFSAASTMSLVPPRTRRSSTGPWSKFARRRSIVMRTISLPPQSTIPRAYKPVLRHSPHMAVRIVMALRAPIGQSFRKVCTPTRRI
jgi:hypothetical protein